MTAKDIFGLFVRMLAVLVLMYGIYQLVFAAAEVAGLTPRATFSTSAHSLIGLVYVVLGVVIILLADAIAALAYRRRRD